ncbi:YhcH/YjgK/YiaL family protein [Scandinavium manionii]|uniref:YhcH/YjgK/YiaL family protein n=1 Tax=Scandinavium manionii TaxID=2926520 RepID=UPI002165F81B|nr:YhcH/YjgK/YiaL family protein [Scandinavium manionii]MCS2164942.1 YhcH/YjgK/YiaL family protein [Scandinavium manionii]
MIIGNLDALPLAGLPAAIWHILSRPDCSLQALNARDDGFWQPENCAWFCNIGVAQTQPRSLRHTEYHHQWADIQVLLMGREVIHAGTHFVAQEDDEERKPDLYITRGADLTVALTLHIADFAIFLPGEPHQALCAADEPETVRKAVFKVPRNLLEA